MHARLKGRIQHIQVSRSEKREVSVVANHKYLVSRPFVGRTKELRTLTDWACNKAYSVFLLDGIGGMGKSMLAWEWANQAEQVNHHWDGILWYSFYKNGADMDGFCQWTLAALTTKQPEDFVGGKTAELGRQLLLELRKRSWLVVMDGLERVLMAFDQGNAPNRSNGEPNDSEQRNDRSPRETIRQEDNDLLNGLVTDSGSSKLLIISRIIPQAFLNNAGLLYPRIRSKNLVGLSPSFAERLLRDSGVTKGDSKVIQDYLKDNCDCHPLTIGALGGLIAHDYLPARGNFDAWLLDPAGSGKLDLAMLTGDVATDKRTPNERKRHSILSVAIDAASDKGRELLYTLSFLSGEISYTTLQVFNPYLPPEPDAVTKPPISLKESNSEDESRQEKKEKKRNYNKRMKRYRKYQKGIEARMRLSSFSNPIELNDLVRDLIARGLLELSNERSTFGLHPLVRSAIASRLTQNEKQVYGRRVVNYFARQQSIPCSTATKLSDVANHMQIIRSLIQMGNLDEAIGIYYMEDLANALLFHMEAYSEVLSILRLIFPKWNSLPDSCIPIERAAALLSDAGISLVGIGEIDMALQA